MDISKKTAAAVTAVLAYIQEEEAAAQQAGAAAQPQAATAEPRANLWGISGRQEMMQMGALMQMRTFLR